MHNTYLLNEWKKMSTFWNVCSVNSRNTEFCTSVSNTVTCTQLMSNKWRRRNRGPASSQKSGGPRFLCLWPPSSPPGQPSGSSSTVSPPPWFPVMILPLGWCPPSLGTRSADRIGVNILRRSPPHHINHNHFEYLLCANLFIHSISNPHNNPLNI